MFSLPQEWLWCESWCSDASKAEAKTIDLCNNPQVQQYSSPVSIIRSSGVWRGLLLACLLTGGRFVRFPALLCGPRWVVRSYAYMNVGVFFAWYVCELGCLLLCD